MIHQSQSSKSHGTFSHSQECENIFFVGGFLHGQDFYDLKSFRFSVDFDPEKRAWVARFWSKDFLVTQSVA